jgi:hypothetical protein
MIKHNGGDPHACTFLQKQSLFELGSLYVVSKLILGGYATSIPSMQSACFSRAERMQNRIDAFLANWDEGCRVANCIDYQSPEQRVMVPRVRA